MKKVKTPAEVRVNDLYNSLVSNLNLLGIKLEVSHIDSNLNKPVYNLYVNDKLVLSDLYEATINTYLSFAMQDYMDNLIKNSNEDANAKDIQIYPKSKELCNEFERCPRCGKTYLKSNKNHHTEYGCIL